MNGLSEVTVIKRKVLKEVATLAWQDRLGEIDALPKRLTQEGITNYRCCEYRERAILADRIKLALGADLMRKKKDYGGGGEEYPATRYRTTMSQTLRC